MIKNGIISFLCLLIIPFSFAGNEELKEFVPHSLIVKILDSAELPKDKSIESYRNLFGNLYEVKTIDDEAALAFLEGHSSVDYVQRNYKGKKRKLFRPGLLLANEKSMTNTVFNDPQAGSVWSFRDADQHGMSVTKAYTHSSGAQKQTIIVAVVDTGVDYTHPDLRDVMWVNPNEIPSNGIDDDGNGYVDDIFGINTLQRDAQGRATPDIRDTAGHGTHVSGTIGAKQNNNIGIAGIASNVRIMAIRTVPNEGDETDVNVVESFIYAARMGAKIINCSFGKAHNEGGNAVSDAIKYIGDNYGVLVIAAAGNDRSNIDQTPTYPASFRNENLLTVAATNFRGSMSWFSNYGANGVDVAAPGSDILSSVPGGGYASYSGTSMATPATVGVAAEILSHYPTMTPAQLKGIIMQSVSPVSNFQGRIVTGGRVDLFRAFQLTQQYINYYYANGYY